MTLCPEKGSANTLGEAVFALKLTVLYQLHNNLPIVELNLWLFSGTWMFINFSRSLIASTLQLWQIEMLKLLHHAALFWPEIAYINMIFMGHPDMFSLKKNYFLKILINCFGLLSSCPLWKWYFQNICGYFYCYFIHK